MTASSLSASSPNGLFLLAALLGGVGFIVFSTTRLKLHPFLALIVAAYAMGLCGGLNSIQTAAVLTEGVGQTVGHIGVVIACGS
ncbi:MAG TPA: hypothetical protein PLV87_02630, partial [Opitutaceae bacterium]|nr:hypothetical protein [Opitutaceae bacterium]